MNQLILIHDWPYKFAVDSWVKRTNSDIKRMFEQAAVKIIRSEKGPWGLNNTDVKPISINLSTKLKELEFGDYILFGGRKDINRVFLEVLNDYPALDPEMTIYRWIIENKQDLYDLHFDLGKYSQ